MTDTNRTDASQASLRERAAGTASHARDTIEDTYRAARDRASKAYDSAAEGVEHAYDATARRVKQAARTTAGSVDTAPLAVLAGGVAAGLVAGLLLPRSRREAELLAPVGTRLNETATAAAQAARDAGKEQLATLGLSRESAKSKVNEFVDTARSAAKEVGGAAVAGAAAAGQGSRQAEAGDTGSGGIPAGKPDASDGIADDGAGAPARAR